MIRTIVTAFAAVALVALGGGVASADIISQSTSEESHQKTDSSGTSNDVADHMANGGPGIVEGDTPGHKYVLVPILIVDENGAPVLNAAGNKTYRYESRWAPVGNGAPAAEIVHN